MPYPDIDLTPAEGPLWLDELLRKSAANGWCTNRGCTTCGCPEMRAIITGHTSPTFDRAFLSSVDVAQAERVVQGLRRCNPFSEEETTPNNFGSRYREAVMWLLWALWLRFGDGAHDQFFPRLNGTWSGGVLEDMKRHYAAVEDRRRRHWARQGVKKKNSTV